MRTIALVKRIIHQMLRDKRALALMMVAPLIILTLLHYLLSGNTVEPRLGVINGDDTLVEQLKDKDIIVKQYDQIKNTKKVIIDDELDGVLQFNDEKLN